MEPLMPAQAASALAPPVLSLPAVPAALPQQHLDYALGPASEPDDDDRALRSFSELIDNTVHAAVAQLTGGLSPAALAGAYLDWASHLAFSPGKRAELVAKGWRKWARFGNYASHCLLGHEGLEPCITPLPQDHRFAEPAWQLWPFNLMY